MNIVIDVDGCILKLEDYFYKYITGKSYKNLRNKTYLFEKDIPGWKWDEKVFNDFANSPFFTKLPFLKDAKKVINGFQPDHKVYLCTHLKTNGKSFKNRIQNLKSLKFSEIHFVKDRKQKIDYCKKVGADVFIDNHPETILRASRGLNHTKIIMPLYPYNKYILRKTSKIVGIGFNNNFWLKVKKMVGK